MRPIQYRLIELLLPVWLHTVVLSAIWRKYRPESGAMHFICVVNLVILTLLTVAGLKTIRRFRTVDPARRLILLSSYWTADLGLVMTVVSTIASINSPSLAGRCAWAVVAAAMAIGCSVPALYVSLKRI